MNRLKIKPVEINGVCPAQLELDSEFDIMDKRLENPVASPICFLAFSHLPISVWQLQSGERFFAHVSCPGCITDMEHENRVIFLLGHSDKWQLSQLISAYLSSSKQWGETAKAKQYKDEAIILQGKQDFAGAATLMEQAVAALKPIDGTTLQKHHSGHSTC